MPSALTGAVDEGTLDDGLTRFFGGDPRTISVPYSFLSKLREAAPVYRFGAMVVVSSYAEAKTVLQDRACYDAAQQGFGDLAAQLPDDERQMFSEILAFDRLKMFELAGEDHRRVRGAAQRAFTPRRVAELGMTAERLTDVMLDELEAIDGCDILDFCYRMPLFVILDMLGIPHSDADDLKRWSEDSIYHLFRNELDPGMVRRSYGSLCEFRDYCSEMVQAMRQGSAGSDLAAVLLEADAEALISEEEFAAMVNLLIVAGHETTMNLIANGLIALLSNRDQWHLLCSDPDRYAAGAVEEALRFDPSAQLAVRAPLEEMTLGGVSLAPGTPVVTLLAAANRDPNVFEDPDSFDLRRSPNNHLGFGSGVHVCLGAALARLEAQVAFKGLARRFPRLELVTPPSEIEWTEHPLLHGPKALNVVFGE